MTRTSRALGATLLRQLRESRGWSWSELARALCDTGAQLGVTAIALRQRSSVLRAIARWESATASTGPGDRYQFLLAHLYARTPAGQVALGLSSDLHILLDALRAFGVPEARIATLVELVSTSISLEGTDPLTLLSPATHAQVGAALRHPQLLDGQLCRRLADEVAGINGQIGVVPFGRLQVLLAPVVQACRHLLHAGPSVAAGNELRTVAATSFALAARLAFETRDDDAAIRLYEDATGTAGEHDDRRHRAEVGTSYTMVTLYATGDVKAAGEIARAAVADAHASTSVAVRARAHAVHAELCARAGHGDAAKAALERAWTTIGQPQVEVPAHGFNADRLNGFDGLCALHAGDAGHAHERLTSSLARLTQPRDAVQRGIVTADLSLARLRLGEPAACAELLHDSVDIAARTGGRVAALRVRHVRAALRPWRSEPFVLALDDHIHDQLIGA
ncbi:hypothetical protein N8J89_16250 [Crossiella sp. CA-258035]|uniref:hypothetical protein n=1 Tax=Crossiella sp. CA-258035 TaxID=2981138 RepID=UPI0024BD2B6F|nr:hypothetical protein [Crossiella sp. CA-258035]WHT22550.1 hypothetical protein N8J89_16250 [Crossiella sp. CA-258035]